MSKTLENLTGCILANFVANTYNEKITHTIHYKHRLKLLINPLIKELVKIEEKEYNLIEGLDEKSVETLSDNYLKFLDLMTKGTFRDFMELQNLVAANSLDSKRMQSIANKILKEKQ